MGTVSDQLGTLTGQLRNSCASVGTVPHLHADDPVDLLSALLTVGGNVANVREWLDDDRADLTGRVLATVASLGGPSSPIPGRWAPTRHGRHRAAEAHPIGGVGRTGATPPTTRHPGDTPPTAPPATVAPRMPGAGWPLLYPRPPIRRPA